MTRFFLGLVALTLLALPAEAGCRVFRHRLFHRRSKAVCCVVCPTTPVKAVPFAAPFVIPSPFPRVPSPRSDGANHGQTWESGRRGKLNSNPARLFFLGDHGWSLFSSALAPRRDDRHPRGRNRDAARAHRIHVRLTDCHDRQMGKHRIG